MLDLERLKADIRAASDKNVVVFDAAAKPWQLTQALIDNIRIHFALTFKDRITHVVIPITANPIVLPRDFSVTLLDPVTQTQLEDFLGNETDISLASGDSHFLLAYGTKSDMVILASY
jgi:hypothetical protein